VIAANLLAQGMSPQTPVVVVENATLLDRRSIKLDVGTLPRVAQLGIAGPAVILVGEVYAQAQLDALPALPATRCA
jgi:siroheme synthase